MAFSGTDERFALIVVWSLNIKIFCYLFCSEFQTW